MKLSLLESLKLLDTQPKSKKRQRTKCEVYSRVVGYLRPVSQWNPAKQEEFKDRKVFKLGNYKSK
jgi:anaerobic ribonucleoside-triphosphate reductase